MKNKKVIAVIVIVLIALIAGISYFVTRKGDSENNNSNPVSNNNNTINTTPTETLKDPAFLPPNDRKYYPDKVYYHKDPKCKNNEGFIGTESLLINYLLVQGKKPCSVCVPEDEAKENREGRK